MPDTHTTRQPGIDLIENRPERVWAALLLDDDERILLERRGRDHEGYLGLWDLPLIAVPAGAVPEDVVLERAIEEFGVQPDSLFLETVQDDCHEGVNYRRFVFRLGFAGDVRLTSAMRWYTRKELGEVFQLNPLVAVLPAFGGRA